MKNTTLCRVWARVKSLFPLLVNFKRYLAGEVFVSWSQAGEDVLLGAFLRDRLDNASYRGFWVDIGANNPVKWSNTKMYSDRGWRGINVDASPEAVALLEQKRPRDINVNVGINMEEGMFEYYVMSSDAMNTFSKEFAEEAVEKGNKILIVRKMKVITLSQLLEQHLPAGQHIDFFTIDAEGLDLTILKSNDWKKFRPDYILIEIHAEDGNDTILSAPASKFLESVGYRFVGQALSTTLYRQREQNAAL